MHNSVTTVKNIVYSKFTKKIDFVLSSQKRYKEENMITVWADEYVN